MPPEKIRKFEELDSLDPRRSAPNRFYPTVYGEVSVAYGEHFTGTLNEAVRVERQMRQVTSDDRGASIDDPANAKQRAEMFQQLIDQTDSLDPKHRIDFS